MPPLPAAFRAVGGPEFINIFNTASIFKKIMFKTCVSYPGVVAHTFDFSTWETEAGESL